MLGYFQVTFKLDIWHESRRKQAYFRNKVYLHKQFAFSVLTLQAPIYRFQFLGDKVPFPVAAHIYTCIKHINFMHPTCLVDASWE